MGANNSRNKKEHKIEHERFQNSRLINDQQIQIIVRTTLDDYNTWKSNLKKINNSNKQNILYPINHVYQQQGWCSQNTGLVKITYDNYPFVFEQQLQNRIQLDKHLSQQQMWYLLYTLVSTVKDFSYINKKVGDIRPHNIFVNEAGQIKLAVCFSYPNQQTNLQKTMNNGQITYISPQQLQIIKNKKLQTIINIIISQSFSIGLTMLHAGLLFNFKQIYNLQKCQINKKLLQDKINIWMDLQFFDQNNNKCYYSSALKQIIRNLCILDLNIRQKSTQIYNLLQPHKQAILNIQPFQLIYNKNTQRVSKKQLINNIHQHVNIINSHQPTNMYPNIQSHLTHSINYHINHDILQNNHHTQKNTPLGIHNNIIHHPYNYNPNNHLHTVQTNIPQHNLHQHHFAQQNVNQQHVNQINHQHNLVTTQHYLHPANYQPGNLLTTQRRVSPTKFVNHLQKSSSYTHQNYTQLSRQIPTTIQTPISINPNYDWSTRAFTQVPANKGNNIHNHVQFFQKYANSNASSPPKIGQVNIKLTNTMSQKRQSGQVKSLYHVQQHQKQGVITVRPFIGMNEQIQNNNNVFKPIHIGPLQGQIEKKVESRDIIHIGGPGHGVQFHHHIEGHIQKGLYDHEIKQKRYNVQVIENKFKIQPIVNNGQSLQFLRKIDQQIQKSKSMFPS